MPIVLEVFFEALIIYKVESQEPVLGKPGTFKDTISGGKKLWHR